MNAQYYDLARRLSDQFGLNYGYYFSSFTGSGEGIVWDEELICHWAFVPPFILGAKTLILLCPWIKVAVGHLCYLWIQSLRVNGIGK